MGNIWVTSDTHFSHERILSFKTYDGLLVRPGFYSTEHMDQVIIDNWNSVVKQGDKVYHLGDVFFGPKDNFKKLWPKLNGRKRLIVGNHDDIGFLSGGGFFDKVNVWRVFTDLKLILTHIPIHEKSLTERSGGFSDKWRNVHGHIHEKTMGDDRYVNVCVERTNYTPVHIEEI